ncbi:hypothetical protein N0V82_007404 [Gnomoniopsis sp. IMI 355080]|nr:hypothetical protein N0V82_007404 [Gnomoniopsis sp. IMI 355080]
MTSNRSSTSSDDSGWHPAPMTSLSQAPITKPEEIQIVLLGAPGTGKTRLQSRYTLRQFVGIDSHGMGGHKHLRLPDGTDVHLIIHELRTGRVWGTKDSTSEEDRHQEDCQRKRLLEQSDAVMLVFNPWSRASYEWINGKIIQDVLYTGRKKQLTSDIVRLLDGLAAAMPKRTLSNRSARSGLSFNSMMKKLPRRPDDADSDNESEFSFFSDEKDEKFSAEDRMDYRGELKRISIVVEGSALKKAEFMIHEKDLPSPPPLETIRPLSLPEGTSNTRLSRMLPTIREVDENSRKQQRVAVMMDRRHLPIMKHDSMISLESASSSAYSETTATVVNYASELSDNTHPIYRDSNAISETVVDETTGRPTYQRSSSRSPTGETEMPVLVVATMVDKLKDRGGALDRHITPHQGQQLARKFGPNCAYIETSAKTNANVDEAYGIIVDQVMAKRAAARRDDIARARIEAAIAAVQADPPSATRAMPGSRAARSCMPQWTWLDNLFARLPSWETVSEKVSRVFETSDGNDQSGEESAGIVEDVWGEEVVKKPRHSQASARNSKRNSKGLSVTQDSVRLSQRKSQSAPLGMGSRTMSHDPTKDTSLNEVFKEMGELDAMEMSPEEEKTQGASQSWVIMPDRPDMMGTNPFEKDEFKRPMNMVTVTTLESKTPTEGKQQRRGAEILQKIKRSSSFKDVRQGSNSEARKSRVELEAQKSRVGERAPSLPPLTFDAIIIDDKRASVSVLVRSADQERNDDTIEQFLTQDATRDSMVVMLSPTTATRTLSAFVKEINSSRANKAPEGMETAKVVPVTTKESRRASEGLPGVAPLMAAESEIEKRVKRITSPDVLPVELPVGDDDFLTVMGLGTASAAGAGEPSPAAVIKEPSQIAAVEQTSLAAVVESPIPVSADKSLPTTPPTPPPTLKTKPSTPRKDSPPATLSSPFTSDNNNNKSSVPPVPAVHETLRTPPAALLPVAPQTTKDSSLNGRGAPIVTIAEVHGSESSGDEWSKRPAHLRTPPNPRRARIRTKDNKKPPPPVRPARPQRSGTRPMSAWI